MQAAQYAASGGHRVVVLHKHLVEAGLGQGPAAVGLRKEAAFVAQSAGFDEQDIGYGERGDLGHDAWTVHGRAGARRQLALAPQWLR